MQFPGGGVASVATAVGVLLENVLRIFGTEGSIFVPNPWVHEREGGTNARVLVTRQDSRKTREIVCDTKVTSFTLETEIASKAILAGRKEPPSPAMTWADSLGNMRALDAWRSVVGLGYDMEKRI
jgi:predicted dehydrogenase